MQERILAWYKINGRDLPWRKTRDPYTILVAEVMLQQTQVSRVVPKYAAFLKKFPTFASLARARKRTLLTLWSGLGYNSRALRLQQLAQVVTREYEGKLPRQEVELATLPGMGPYTRRAVQIFAWDRDVVCVDTNIRRILLHELGLEHDTPLLQLEQIAEACLPRGRSREWHNALMDYGALVLTSRSTGIKAKAKSPKPFRTSKRYYRGQIMKMLLKNKRVTLAELQQWYQHETTHVIAEIVEELAAEKLLRIRDSVLQI